MRMTALFLAVALAGVWNVQAEGGVSEPPPLQATWGQPVDLGPGGYARIRRLADGRYMAAYSRGGNMTIAT